MRSLRKLLPVIAVMLMGVVAFNVRAQDKDKDKDKDAVKPLDAIRSLEGTWVSTEPGPDGKMNEIIFKVTAGGSAVVETMFPGDKFEMVNAYHMDGERMLVTHYCAQGVQPRMKLVSFEDRTLKFEFLDCTNLKPGAGHMGGLELVIDGDKLTEKWSYLQDGKLAGEPTVFEFVKKS